MPYPSPPTTLQNAGGERLAFSYAPGRPGGRDIVVLGHGVTSDKDRPWSRSLATELTALGIATLRIAFSGNGESEGDFLESTITKEIEDLRSVVEALEGWRVSYVGHSMGGAVGLLATVGGVSLHALVSLAAVTHTAEFGERVFGHLAPGQAMLDKPHCPWGRALAEDLAGWGSIAERSREVGVPWLVVHGDADEIVPQDHSLDLARCAGDRAELVILEGVDHSFTGAGLGEMTQVVTRWLDRQLAD